VVPCQSGERLELAPADAVDVQGLPDDVPDAFPGPAVFPAARERTSDLQGGSRSPTDVPCGDGRVPSPSPSISASRSAFHTS
jgi:hypothetical protein